MLSIRRIAQFSTIALLVCESGCIRVRSNFGEPISYEDRALAAKYEEEFAKRALDPIEGFWHSSSQFIEGACVVHQTDPSNNNGFPFAAQTTRAWGQLPAGYHLTMNDRIVGRLKPTENPRVYQGEAEFIKGSRVYWLPVTVTLLDQTTVETVAHTTEAMLDGNTRRANLIGPKKELDARLAAMAAKRSGATTQPTLVGGSGFLVSGTLVVTNQHVVAQGKGVRCFIGMDAISAHVIAHDDGNDLALLTARG